MITQTYYIGTGEKSAMFTLRMCRRNDDPRMDAFMPDHYLCNLASTDEDGDGETRAIEKAKAYVETMRERIGETDEFKITFGGVWDEPCNVRRGKLSVRDTHNMEMIERGVFPFGKHAGKRIDEVDGGYVCFFADKIATANEPVAYALAAACMAVAIQNGHIVARDDPDDDEPWHSEERLFIGNDETYRHHFAESDPVIFWGFDGLSAFVDHVASLERAPSPRDKAWAGKPEFTGTASFAEAIEIARTGWLDALGMADLIDLPPPRLKRRTRSVAGGTVSVGRMLSGAPDHMLKRRRAPAKKIITLFVETVAWIKIRHDVLLVRSLAVAAIIDNLETHGYRCNVVAVYSTYRDDWAPLQTAVKLKDAGERLNLADISFAFGHPSFGRRLIYAARSIRKAYTQLHDGDDGEAARGYVGHAFTDDHQPGPNEFYIRGLFQNITDIIGILKLIEPINLPVTIIERD